MSFNCLPTIVESDLENLFNNLNISIDDNNLTVMATPTLKPEFISMIPEFKGEAELLPRFLEICEKLVNRFYNAANVDDFQNEYLMSSIRSKIKGDAALNLSSCVVKNWFDLKTNLLHAYSDKRDSYTLCLELSNLKQNPIESPFDFYNKIQKNLNLQISYLLTHCQADEATILSNYFNNYALRILLKGLRDPLGSLMRTKNPKDLNEALNMLTNDFQIETHSSQKPNQTNPRFNQKPQNSNFKAYNQNSNYKQANFKPTQYNQNFNKQNSNNNFSRQNNYQNTQKSNFNTQNYAQKRTFSNVTNNQNNPNPFKKSAPTQMSACTINSQNPVHGAHLNNIDFEPQNENLDYDENLDFEQNVYDQDNDNDFENFPIHASEVQDMN